jgi:ABC-type uncharacterized transport system involved in gliding motility auxiliary subunit
MPAFESFRTVRWFRTFNLVLQAVLFLTLFGGLNYVALNHPGRYDLTRHHRYSLSPETLAYLHNLNQPVHVVVTLTDDSDHPEVIAALTDVHGLLREYTYATEANYDPKTGRDGRVTVTNLDVDRQLREASQLGIEQRNAIVFLCGDKPPRVVALGEIYRVENGAATSFIGEQAFTAAILDVSSPEQKKIYFLSGHGESRIDDADPAHGLSALANELRLRNFAVETADISATRKVPDDAALVIAAGPQKVDAYTQEQLRQYLGPRAGHMLLLLAPGAAPDIPTGLTDLLLDWGVLVDDDIIYDSDRNEMTENGDLRVRFLGPHPITQSLIQMKNVGLLVSRARSIRPSPAATGGLIVTTLAATSTTAWGERSFFRTPEYNPGVDVKGLPQMEPKNRLGMIVASERAQPRDNLPNSVPSGRLVVFGSTDFATNSGFLAVAGNQNIVLNAVNWAIGREQINVPARPVERFKLSLSAQELVRLRYSLLFLVPGAAALLGLIVYWTRRN